MLTHVGRVVEHCRRRAKTLDRRDEDVGKCKAAPARLWRKPQHDPAVGIDVDRHRLEAAGQARV